MSSNSSLVYKNFVWKLESASVSTDATSKRFAHMESSVMDSGRDYTRVFSLQVGQAGELIELTDLYSFRSEVTFLLTVYYSVRRMIEERISTLLLDDRKTIVSELYPPSSYSGYDSAHTSQDIGLLSRIPSDMSVNAEDDAIVVQHSFKCLISEAF